MHTRQGVGKKPASVKRSEEYLELPSRKIFSWGTASRHNTCLALVAEEESIEGTLPLEEEMYGILLSPMYRLLQRELKRALKESESDADQAFALNCFAARCYRAGRHEGLTPVKDYL